MEFQKSSLLDTQEVNAQQAEIDSYYNAQNGTQPAGPSEEVVSQSVSQPSEEYSFEDPAQPFQPENVAGQNSMEEGEREGEGEEKGKEEQEEEQEEEDYDDEEEDYDDDDDREYQFTHSEGFVDEVVQLRH